MACIGRCDAKCYEATSQECDCICGGMNHGAGLKKARDNTRNYADEWIEKFKVEKNMTDVTGKMNEELLQLSIF